MLEDILPPEEFVPRILIVGGESQAEQLVEYVEHTTSQTPNIVRVDGAENVNVMTEKLSAYPTSTDWSHVIIMAFRNPNSSGGESRIDAQTILRTHVVQGALANRDSRASIVAEVLNVDNRQLFEETQVDIVAPSSLVTERVLAWLVEGCGYVSTMMARWFPLKMASI